MANENFKDKYIDVAKRRLFLAWNELDKKNKRHICRNNLIDEFEAEWGD